MSDNVISVLTYKSVETILRTGGTQSWTLERTRARSCKYAVVCRNSHTREAQGPEPHGTAFIIGKIKDVVPSTETEGRWLILFSEYALVDFAEQWEGRNPVAYWTTGEYDEIDFDKLTFQPMPTLPQLSDHPMTIADAKFGLSKSLGVPAEAIEIVIRA